MKSVKINLIIIIIITMLSAVGIPQAAVTAAESPFLSLTVNSVWGSYTYLTLNWTKTPDSGYYYKVERSINEVNYYEVSSFLDASSQSSFSDTLLDSASGNTYSYRLAIYDSTYKAVGSTSNIASIKLSDVTEPTNLKATSISSTEITVSWAYTNSRNAYSTILERKASTETEWTTITILPQDTLKFTDQGLQSNVTYNYRVRGMLGTSNAYSKYAELYDTDTFLKAPYNVTANTVSSNMVIVSWSYDSSEGAYFIIERRVNGGDYVELPATAFNELTYIDADVSANNTYSYRVKAVTNSAASAFSNEARAVSMDLAPSTNLMATAISNTEIELTWADTSATETDFELWRKIGENGTWAEYAVLERNTTSFNDTGLDPNTEYYYRLRAHISTDDSEDDLYSVFSNDAKALTLIPSSTITLSYSMESASKAKLLWNTNFDWDSNYSLNVERRSESDIEWEVLSSSSMNMGSYTDNYLDSYVTYYYRLKLSNSKNSSIRYSNEIFVVPGIPAPPTNLTVEALSPNTARINWTDNSHNEDSFIVERSAPGGDFSRIGSTSENVNSFIDNLLEPGITYHYRVCAVNATGKSTYSNDGSSEGKSLKTFNDLWNHSWAKDAIENLASRGVISGKTDNQFFPDDQITRAEFTSLVIRSFKLSRTPVGYLADVKPSDWFYKDIMTANTMGIISSKDGYFYPDTPITREDMAVIIYKVLKAVDKPLSGHDVKILDAYTDRDEITPYALTPIASLKGEKIIDGRSSTTLAPKDTATRAEASVIIYRIIDR